MFKAIRLVVTRLQAQLGIILALSVYERNRDASESSLGAWACLGQPLQMLLMLLVMRLGLKALMGRGSILAPTIGTVSADLFFDPVTFLATGVSIVFLFRTVAIKSINGLKLKAPLFYARIKPLDILLASALNDVRALATLSVIILSLSWCITWSFRFDRPGLAIIAYLLTVVMAIGLILDRLASRQQSRCKYHLFSIEVVMWRRRHLPWLRSVHILCTFRYPWVIMEMCH